MKNIVIVGASSGIGLEIAKLSAEKGYFVHVLSRTEGATSELLQTKFHKTDILDFEMPLPEIEGPIDGLVYCPGSMEQKPFLETTLEDFKGAFDLNVLGAIRTIQHYLPKLQEAKEGASIVLFSALLAQKGHPLYTNTACAKGAIEGLCKSLAAEFAPLVRFNCIAPSFVETPLTQNILTNEDKKHALASKHPLKRLGHPSDVAFMADFLLSEKAEWITGQTIGVDGGMSTLAF
ncbi:MAG: 3-oxoacyl-[acyl-carrier-protein] reductase 2 [Chlamydiae bacterium]|nr:3-oxoacyl-[acyl-carrier-protein] reductase 2 [Chlamydiota bacterium]